MTERHRFGGAFSAIISNIEEVNATKSTFYRVMNMNMHEQLDNAISLLMCYYINTNNCFCNG